MSHNYYDSTIHNLKDLENNKIYQIGYQASVTESKHGTVYVYSIEGEDYFIPEKWEKSFENNNYLISHGLKKRGKINMYDLHFFKTRKEARDYLNKALEAH